jgi:hypothetical protein
METHTAESLVPQPSPFKFEIAIAKMKRYESPSNEEILANLIQAGSERLHSKVHNSLTVY